MTALLRAFEQGMARGLLAIATSGAVAWCIERLWRGPHD